MTPPTTEPSPQPPHRWGFINRIAVAYWLLLGFILVLYFEELIGEFGSDLWEAAKYWVAHNQLRAIEVASVLGGLLAIFIGVVGLRVVRHFGRRREQQLARWATLADPKDLPKLEIDFRASRFQLVTTIAQVGVGAALLVGIFFTYQTLNATREGQVTERFIRAVDQLGATDKDGKPTPEIRLARFTASGASRRIPAKTTSRSSRFSTTTLPLTHPAEPTARRRRLRRLRQVPRPPQ